MSEAAVAHVKRPPAPATDSPGSRRCAAMRKKWHEKCEV